MVIPKTVNIARISDNKKSTEVKLDPEDMRQLREIDRNSRLLVVQEDTRPFLAYRLIIFPTGCNILCGRGDSGGFLGCGSR